MSASRRSSATWLWLVYGALVVYASLYPMEGWRWPPGQTLGTLLELPGSPYHTAFDRWSNLLGYLPFGLLGALAALRSGLRVWPACTIACATAALLSYGCEVTQHFVPGRVPSLDDFVLNALGSAAGALLALVLHVLGWVSHWQALRARWFAGDGAFALALLALWPVSLLFPTAVPLGLGQIGERLREAVDAALGGVAWAAGLHAVLTEAAPASGPLRPLTEVILVALGLLAPCLVAFSVAAPGWRRLPLSLGALALAVLAMSLSTLLNFGPPHGLAWVTPVTVQGLALGLGLALALTAMPRRVVAGVGLAVLTAWLLGVAQAPDDPYLAQSLRAWEQGRFVRFHGLAQWLGWLWPYAAMTWLFWRLAAPPPRR